MGQLPLGYLSRQAMAMVAMSASSQIITQCRYMILNDSYLTTQPLNNLAMIFGLVGASPSWVSLHKAPLFGSSGSRNSHLRRLAAQTWNSAAETCDWHRLGGLEWVEGISKAEVTQRPYEVCTIYLQPKYWAWFGASVKNGLHSILMG